MAENSSLDHLLDKKLEEKLSGGSPREDDPFMFQEAELAVSLGYEPELDQRYKLKQEIQESTKKYIRRLDTVVHKDLDTSLMTRFRESQGSISHRFEMGGDGEKSSDKVAGTPPMKSRPRTGRETTEHWKSPTNYTSAGSSQSGSPPDLKTPRRSETRATGGNEGQTWASSGGGEWQVSELDQIMASSRWEYEKLEKKRKAVNKLRILEKPRKTQLQSAEGTAGRGDVRAGSPSVVGRPVTAAVSAKKESQLQHVLSEYYIQKSLSPRAGSPRSWAECQSSFSWLQQESELVSRDSEFHKTQMQLQFGTAPAVTDLICERRNRDPPAYQESLSHKFFEIKTAKLRDRATRESEKQKKVALLKIRSEAKEKFQGAAGRSPRGSLFGTKTSLPKYLQSRRGDEASEDSELSRDPEKEGVYSEEQRLVLAARRKVQRKMFKVLEAHPETFKVGSILDCRRRLELSPYAYVLHGATHDSTPCSPLRPLRSLSWLNSFFSSPSIIPLS